MLWLSKFFIFTEFCTFVTGTINHGDQILSYLVENILISKKKFVAGVDNNHAYDYIETFILVN